MRGDLAAGRVKSDVEYVCLFYDFVGNSASTIGQIFFLPYFKAIVNEENYIHNAAVAIGIAYAGRPQNLMSELSADETKFLTELREKLHVRLRCQVQEPHPDTDSLIFAVLVGTLEVRKGVQYTNEIEDYLQLFSVNDLR